ncbi:MAG: hypothetical protein AB8H47_02440 [Bacteroidia bacterium]
MWNELLHSIKHSQYQIQIALPELVAPDLLGALLQSQKRGVHLQWVMEKDKLTQSSTSVIIQSMLALQAQCWTLPELPEYFIIIDHQLVWSSAFPWGGAYGKDDPWAQLSKIETSTIVQAFQYRWQHILVGAEAAFGERPYFSFFADKAFLKAGDSSCLYWDCPMGSEVMISPKIGSVPARGKRIIQVNENTHFQLEARYQGKVYRRNYLLRCQRAPSVLFEADQTHCKAGSNVRIWWHSDQAHAIAINSLGLVAAVGQDRIQVFEDTEIRLLAIGPREHISRSIHIFIQ